MHVHAVCAAGRLAYVREVLGMEAELVEYCAAATSLENALLLVSFLQLGQHLEVFLRQLLDLFLVRLAHRHHLLLQSAQLVLEHLRDAFLLLVAFEKRLVLGLQAAVLLGLHP